MTSKIPALGLLCLAALTASAQIVAPPEPAKPAAAPTETARPSPETGRPGKIPMPGTPAEQPPQPGPTAAQPEQWKFNPAPLITVDVLMVSLSEEKALPL